MKSSRRRPVLALQPHAWLTLDSGRCLPGSCWETDVTDSGRRFAQAIIKAAQGQTGIVEPAYVYLPGVPGGDAASKDLGVEYFAVPVSFGANGAETAHPIGSLSDYETKLLKVAVDELKGNVKKGEDFARA